MENPPFTPSVRNRDPEIVHDAKMAVLARKLAAQVANDTGVSFEENIHQLPDPAALNPETIDGKAQLREV